MLRSRAGDLRGRQNVGAQGQLGLLLAAHDADPRRRVDDHVGPSLGDGRLGHAVLCEVAVAPLERVNLVGSIPVTKLVDQRAADEAGCSRDQDIHGRRVYWRACALLAAVLVAGGCNEGKRRASPPPTQTQSFLALDAQQQRLVADYQPVSRALAVVRARPRRVARQVREDRRRRAGPSAPRPRSRRDRESEGPAGRRTRGAQAGFGCPAGQQALSRGMEPLGRRGAPRADDPPGHPRPCPPDPDSGGQHQLSLTGDVSESLPYDA